VLDTPRLDLRHAKSAHSCDRRFGYGSKLDREFHHHEQSSHQGKPRTKVSESKRLRPAAVDQQPYAVRMTRPAAMASHCASGAAEFRPTMLLDPYSGG
jgi:hypothetical protein